jgi:hypothetical protein
MSFIPVTLVSPSGIEEHVTDPTRYNNLVMGNGYKVKPEPKPEPAKVDEAEKPVTKRVAK